ncbi:MAG: outer membrane protein assembly factor BamA [Bacteroidetes bacterium]|nr:MAG: outer membrane protein assembly factor BamA [Bacteroidota bacterium]
MKKIAMLCVFLCFVLSQYGYAQRLFPNKKNTPAKTEEKSEEDNKINPTQPKDYNIANIRVTGTKFLDAGALVSLSGLRLGMKIKIPGEALPNAIKKLWKQGILGDVQIAIEKIEGDNVYLHYILTERPKLSRFIITGVRKGEITTLTDKLGLIRGKIVTPTMLKNTQNIIQKHYGEKGYLNAKIAVMQKTDTLLANSVALNIQVNKGKRVKIKTLQFEDVTAFSQKRLSRKLKGTKQKQRGNIFRNSKFIKSKFEEDKENLIKFYNGEGYRDARVVSDSLYKIGTKYVGLKIVMDEGRKYYYRNITWKGNYVHDDKTLSSILRIQKGDVYDVQTLEKRLNFSQSDLDITSLYMDDGYLFFSINPVEVGIEGDSIDVEMQVYEGAQANVNQIILNGNTKTSDHVVRRELRTLPGEKFRRSDIIRSNREISTLNYFDAEKIGINPIPNMQDGTVDIDYSVVEKPSDQVELSGGWGGVFGFVGTLGVVFNNFSAKKIFKPKQWGGILPSGDGQRLAVRFQANGRRFQTYSLTFTEPWLGGKRPNNLSLNVSHSVQRTIDFNGNVLGGLQVTSATLSLGRRLKWPDNYFTVTNSIIYQRYNLNNYGGFLFDKGTGVANSVAFNTTISRNSVDNPMFPKSGSNINFSATFTPPYSLFNKGANYETMNTADKFRWIEYHKWMLDNTWFTPLPGKFVLSTRAHFGYIGAYNDQLGVGPFERFVLGGDGLTGQNFLLGLDIIGLRGYENNSVTPQGLSGGVLYNKFVLDVRYPISNNPAATIFALTFIEAGNNVASYAEYSPFDLKRSAGVGARIFMPAFGMLGLDWGYGFDEIPGKGRGGSRFHFTIGQQIR